MNVTILHNDELGFPLFSVCDPNDELCWVDSFDYLDNAICFAKQCFGLDVEIDFKCEIDGCACGRNNVGE